MHANEQYFLRLSQILRLVLLNLVSMAFVNESDKFSTDLSNKADIQRGRENER